MHHITNYSCFHPMTHTHFGTSANLTEVNMLYYKPAPNRLAITRFRRKHQRNKTRSLGSPPCFLAHGKKEWRLAHLLCGDGGVILANCMVTRAE